MNLRKIALAAAAGTALLAAAPAFAQSHWNRGYGWQAQHRHHYYRPRAYFYAPPAPVYYAPAPVYYTPPPAYYAPRSPAIYGRVPLGHHSSIGFSLPLN